MGKLFAKINDKLEIRFRTAVLIVKGNYRGNISEAVEEALKDWLDKYKEKLPKIPENNT